MNFLRFAACIAAVMGISSGGVAPAANLLPNARFSLSTNPPLPDYWDLHHVAALTLAHDRALVLYREPRLAVRSQYWMLGVMVGFTSLALWLLASAGR